MNCTLVEAPFSNSTTQYETLAYLEVYDAVLNSDYAFVAYKETDSSGAWRVRIKSVGTAGAVFEPVTIRNKAREIFAQGKTSFPWGYSLEPCVSDPRIIQFRVHLADGQPSEIEICARMRRFDGTADAMKSVRFRWPAAPESSS